MAFQDHFKLADDMILHLNPFVASISDSFITSRYVGFIAVSAVTVYELAIKDIFSDFANSKHKVLGNFSSSYFDRLNGRIKLKELKENHISRFGDKYVKRFKRKLELVEQNRLNNNGISVTNSYTQVITARHDFAHAGHMKMNLTYQEITTYYKEGKEVILCLAETMRW